MKKNDWEGAYPNAPQSFENAVNQALAKTRAAKDQAKAVRFSGKRRLILALALLLLLLGAVTAIGIVDRGYNLMQQEVYDTDKSMAVIGDTLYVTDGFKLLSYNPGDGDYVTLINQVVRHDSYMAPEQKSLRKSPYYIDLLLNIDGKLCGMNGKSGLLFEIGWENGEGTYTNIRKLKLQYNMCRGNNDDTPRSMTSPVVAHNTLYFVQRDPYAGNGEERVAAYDLKTGEGGLKKVKDVCLLAPYQDGMLLAVTNDREKNRVTLCVYDPAADTLKEARDLSGLENASRLFSLEYSAEKDCAYLFDSESGAVYQLPGLGAPEKIAQVSNVSYVACTYGRASALVENTFYCTQDRKGLYIRNLEAGYQAPLSIRAEFGNAGSIEISEDTLRAASGDTGLESTMTRVSSLTDTPTLQELFLTRDDQYDIYVITTSRQELKTILEKGYAPTSPDLLHLNQLEEALYPFIREAVSKNGHMAAVPIGIKVSASYVDTDMLARLGLKNAPHSIPELIEVLEAWTGGAFPHAETGDLPMIDTGDYRGKLIDLALSLYAKECAAKGQPLDFQDLMLSNTLAAIDQMDAVAVNEALGYTWDDEGSDNYIPVKPLLSLNTYFDTNPWGSVQLLPFSLSGSPVAACEVTVAIVNPFGKRQAEAWELLNAYVGAMNQETKTLLCPSLNEPVENPYFAGVQADLLSLIAEMQQAKNADAVADYTAELAEYEKYYRYSFSAEAISQYRELMKNAYITTPNVLENHDSPEFSSLVRRYMDGALSLDQFLREGRAKLSLMLRE